MNIIWLNKFSIGVDALDQQHKQIIDIINDLNKPDHKVEFDAVLDKIKKYVDMHLSFEYSLMIKYSYHNSREHGIQHDLLRDMFDKLINESKIDNSVGKARSMMNKWFVTHITNDKMDVDLGEFLNKIGVFPARKKLI